MILYKVHIVDNSDEMDLFIQKHKLPYNPANAFLGT